MGVPVVMIVVMARVIVLTSGWSVGGQGQCPNL